MNGDLERAIKDLAMAEELIQGAGFALEREANDMTLKTEDSRLRHKDLIDSSEICYSELARKVRLRKRFLISVKQGYEKVGQNG